MREGIADLLVGSLGLDWVGCMCCDVQVAVVE